MSRLPQLTADRATDEQRALLQETERQLGRTPNLYATMANAPAALRGYLAFRDALVGGILSARAREQLALLIAAENSCDYCVAAHTFRGRRMRLDGAELDRTLRADSEDAHVAALLRFAREVLRTGGQVPDAALEEARATGLTDADLAEAIAHVALNTYSNLFSQVAEPELDFPAPELARAA
jgi:uncharacterized peroxidase-related enzyme